MLGAMLIAAGLLVAGISLYAYILMNGGTRHGEFTFSEWFVVVAMGVATLVLLAMSLVEVGFYRYRVMSLLRREEALRDAVEELDAGDQMRKERESATLHDDIGGGLTALRLRLESVRSQCDATAAASQASAAGWDAAFSALDSLLLLVRGAARAFHPRLASELGLSAVLRDMGEKLAGGGGCRIDFDFAGPVDDLGEAEATCVLNVVQEAVVNSLRHSGASSIRVRLERRGGEISGSVSDNGAGLPPSRRNGLGTVLMRERLARRGGSVSEGRSRLGGAEVSFKFPVGRAAS